MKPALCIAFLFCTLLLAVPSNAQTPFDLSGYWETGNIGDYYIRQIDDQLWWYAEDDPISPKWTQIAHGTVKDKIVTLTWIDVPKGRSQLKGTLVLEIKYPDRLVLVKETGGFGGGTEWTRCDRNPED